MESHNSSPMSDDVLKTIGKCFVKDYMISPGQTENTLSRTHNFTRDNRKHLVKDHMISQGQTENTLPRTCLHKGKQKTLGQGPHNMIPQGQTENTCSKTTL